MEDLFATFEKKFPDFLDLRIRQRVSISQLVIAHDLIKKHFCLTSSIREDYQKYLGIPPVVFQILMTLLDEIRNRKPRPSSLNRRLETQNYLDLLYLDLIRLYFCDWTTNEIAILFQESVTIVNESTDCTSRNSESTEEDK
jgi:hypothetical protein